MAFLDIYREKSDILDVPLGTPNHHNISLNVHFSLLLSTMTVHSYCGKVPCESEPMFVALGYVNIVYLYLKLPEMPCFQGFQDIRTFLSLKSDFPAYKLRVSLAQTLSFIAGFSRVHSNVNKIHANMARSPNSTKMPHK